MFSSINRSINQSDLTVPYYIVCYFPVVPYFRITMKNPSWIDYRRQQQFKPRPTMSIEMMMRKSFIQVIKEYTRNCSVAGVNRMTDPNIGWKRRFRTQLTYLNYMIIICKTTDWWVLLYIPTVFSDRYNMSYHLIIGETRRLRLQMKCSEVKLIPCPGTSEE